MMKRIITIGALSLSFIMLTILPNKMQSQSTVDKIVAILYNPKSFEEALTPCFDSVYQQFEIINATEKKQIKDNAFEKYYNNIKDIATEHYKEQFTPAELDDLLHFLESTTGSKYIAKQNEVNQAMGKACQMLYKYMHEAVQALRPQPAKSEAVVHVEEKAKSSKRTPKALLDEYINFDGISVVKFSALWCGPCKQFAPIFETAAEEMKSITIDNKDIEIKYFAVDIDSCQDIADQYSVRSVPTIVFFKDGKKIASVTGYQSKDALIKKIKEIAK